MVGKGRRGDPCHIRSVCHGDGTGRTPSPGIDGARGLILGFHRDSRMAAHLHDLGMEATEDIELSCYPPDT